MQDADQVSVVSLEKDSEDRGVAIIASRRVVKEEDLSCDRRGLSHM